MNTSKMGRRLTRIRIGGTYTLYSFTKYKNVKEKNSDKTIKLTKKAKYIIKEKEFHHKIKIYTSVTVEHRKILQEEKKHS